MNIHFEHPQILWLAVAAIPALAGFFFWSWRVKQKLAVQFVHSRLLPSLTVGVSPAREKVRMVLLVAAVVAVLVALARPQWGFVWEEAKQQGLDIMIAIDTSKSMLARDVVPNRIEKAKLAVIDLMRLAKSDRMGLVVFAGQAFLQSPLTLDEQAFQEAVSSVSVGIVPVGGTSLSSAIRTSLEAFQKENDNHKVLVLFTDGEDHDVDAETMAAVKEAEEAGMKIFTIGVGTPEGELLSVTDDQGNSTYLKDADGNVVKSSLNRNLLEKIATETQGFYLPLVGANPMQTLYDRGLAPLPKTDETTRLTRVYRERYHWFLGFAVLCLIAETLLPERSRSRRSRRSARSAPEQTAAVAVLALLLLAPFKASSSPSSALSDFEAGNYKSAFEEYSRLSQQKTNDYRLHYDTGVAAYKAGKMDAARAQFDAALNTADIISDPLNQQRTYYNLGNTLYRLGEPLDDPDKKKEMWEHAVENYTRAIHLNTNDVDAKSNLAYVQQQLEELKKQQQKKDDQNNDQEPDEAAKAAKARADAAVMRRQYRQALDIMEESLKNDPTTQSYGDYIKRLQEINGVPTAKPGSKSS